MIKNVIKICTLKVHNRKLESIYICDSNIVKFLGHPVFLTIPQIHNFDSLSRFKTSNNTQIVTYHNATNC